MKTIYPKKLKKGDEIRVVAPSLSLSIVSKQNIAFAKDRLTAAGFKISFGKRVREKDIFQSTTITSRVADIREAFSDKNVKAVLCVIGGYNANQLLDYLDYKTIRNNPKIFCGYSDITVLSNAIYARSKLVTYIGPGFSAFAMKKGFNYSLEYFLKCLTVDKNFTVRKTSTFSDDKWYKNQSRRRFEKNVGPWTLRPGTAYGRIVGGNLCTFNLLQGTKYMPDLKDTILFIEEDDLVKGEAFAKEFDRNFQSLAHQPGFGRVKGIVIGRFQKKCLMTPKKLRDIMKMVKNPKIPIVAGADFGHTTPQFTFPIGGEARVSARGGKVKLEILKH